MILLILFCPKRKETTNLFCGILVMYTQHPSFHTLSISGLTHYMFLHAMMKMYYMLISVVLLIQQLCTEIPLKNIDHYKKVTGSISQIISYSITYIHLSFSLWYIHTPVLCHQKNKIIPFEKITTINTTKIHIILHETWSPENDIMKHR